MKNWWDSKSYYLYAYYVSYVSNWALIQEAEYCALQVWASDYFVKLTEADLGTSFASVLVVSLMTFLLN